MNSVAPYPGPPFGRAVALHSLGWLVAANIVGVWLALSLLWPALGDLLAPLTYGRWAPLHLDWQLYGWCSLPVVGVLLTWCFDFGYPHVRRHAGIALTAWSLALALGGIAWLGGNTSGKLFLDWHGWTRPLLPAAMHVLWALLATHTVWRWKRLSSAERTFRAVVLGVLLAAPAVLYWSMDRKVYPSVNPDSGGATGAALLGSTLAIVTIFLLLPAFLGLPALGTRTSRAPRLEAGQRPALPGLVRRTGVTWALVASWGVFLAIDRGHASHHAPAQIVGLGTLGVWVVLLPVVWRRHDWPAGARPWLIASFAWWLVLVVTGWVVFLPGISEALKFTHALVGHAHLAMAGLLTSVNGAVLVVLTGRRAPRTAFWAWQAGCLIHVAAMLVLGWHETTHVAGLFRSESWTQALMAVRLAGGMAMAAASIGWLASLLRP
ncbi:MAG: hypothetical protein Q7S40_33060 [Opitutaceae bacterium]|nr:hypothetical protein [Opitutaceae bacterium]